MKNFRYTVNSNKTFAAAVSAVEQKTSEKVFAFCTRTMAQPLSQRKGLRRNRSRLLKFATLASRMKL
jgi:hypothetical protein